MVAVNPLFNKSLNFHPLVLVVEADEDTRQMMKYLLQMWKYGVIETANAEEALEMTQTEQPDFILISGRIQEGESLVVVQRMGELSPFGKAGIIYISAYSESAVRLGKISISRSAISGLVPRRSIAAVRSSRNSFCASSM